MDMAAKINELLQDPETMQQVQSLAAMLGGTNGGGPPPPPAAAPTPPPAPPAATPGAPPGISMSPEMMGMAMKLASALGTMQRETPDTHFLRALRPLLSEPRQKKLDSAIRLIQLMTVLPALRQSGVLNGLGGLLGS